MKSNRFALLTLMMGVTLAALTGCGSSSSITNPAGVLDTTPPSAPTNVRGSFDAAGNRDYLNWDASSSADLSGYEVWQYWSDPAVGGMGTLVGTLNNQTTVLMLPIVAHDTNCFYRVRAVDQAGNESAFSGSAGVLRHAWPAPPIDSNPDGGNGRNLED